ncbi:winged helix-turn-helix domain-containing protein [Streptomyces mirabilis]
MLWDGALDAQHTFGDLDGHRPALLAVHDAVDDGTAYRAELSARVDEPVLSDDPILQHDLQLPDSWWNDLAVTLAKVSAVSTDRVAVRQQYMDRAIPEFVGIPVPAAPCWTTAHSDVHWANLCAPLRILDWEGWGRAPEGFDAVTLYAYTLLQEDVVARVRDVFPVLGSPAGLAAEATVCAQLLQTVARGDNLAPAGAVGHGAAPPQRELLTLPAESALIGRKFHVSYSVSGATRLMRRLGFTPQMPARRVAERDEQAVAGWKEATWVEVKGPGRPAGATSASRTRRASPAGRPKDAPGAGEATPRSSP